MIERIKELAEQAGSTHKQSLGVYQFYTHELEKFAELIVRECAKSANDWYQNHDKIHSDPMSYVLSHFGVEE
jgi:ATP-dependent protease HslVU (ClpYQ) peptidase subunit